MRYLLDEGARSLDAYLEPDLLSRVAAFGGVEPISDLQASLVNELFEVFPNAAFPSGIKKLPLLEAQKAEDPNAYGPLDLAEDIHEALWADLTSAPRWRRPMQRAYLDRIAAILKEEAAPNRAERLQVRQALTAQGITTAFAASVTSSSADTVFPGWAREMLPRLASRLDLAANEAAAPEDRYHFRTMAARARHLAGGN